MLGSWRSDYWKDDSIHGSALPLPQSSLGPSRATSMLVGQGGRGPKATKEKVLMGSASVITQGGALGIFPSVPGPVQRLGQKLNRIRLPLNYTFLNV